MKKKGLTDIKRKRFFMWTLKENVWEKTSLTDPEGIITIILLIDSQDFNSNYDLIRP
jgi:hypothetical protein